MYVDVATATNSCQEKNRTPKSPGLNPCKETETRGGIWRYDTNKTNQAFSPEERYATGIRNAEGFVIDSSGRMFVTQHGRDQLHANWPELYKPEQEATLPAEELLLLRPRETTAGPSATTTRFRKSWCWRRNMVATAARPSAYARTRLDPLRPFQPIGRRMRWCNMKRTNFRRGTAKVSSSPSTVRGIERPMLKVATTWFFSPLPGTTRPIGAKYLRMVSRGKSSRRPEPHIARVAWLWDPDGSFYVSDDVGGRIYRIVYRGGSEGAAAKVRPCPSLTAPAGKPVEEAAKPPEGTHPDAGAAAAVNIPVPAGATREMVALGGRIYHGEVGGAACTGCHGDGGQGTPLAPALAGQDKKWLWSDGSYAGITRTITEGVPQPKEYRSPMPPMGGAQLTPEHVSALAAYVWSLSHTAASNRK